ncbi:acyl-CoA dehydrogenase family protein [Sphingomonas profundi]|uniref:acyl-CoA dehydrogenase family protein n=1 Tax=Alterirhizorhabdus profundi TaxID=2681549 RepID=UPI0012E86792|nr:acyl-CoA dehydrogenase family protein [Sphingomonas profundi]
MTDWIDLSAAAIVAARDYVRAAKLQAGAAIAPDGRVIGTAATRSQRLLHGFAWIATTVEALAALAEWAARARDGGRFSEVDALVLRIASGEYLAQLLGGVPMSQNELARPRELGLAEAADTLGRSEAVAHFLADGNTAEARAELAHRLAEGEQPDERFGDELLDMIRDQFRAFVADRIAPHAHGWHLADALIPQPIIDEMAAMGVFGICIEEAHGGLGLGKLAMSLVSEELSRGWICAGSLGTRSEIAGELIGAAGTEAQKARWLPALAAGAVLPTAVFTEPDTGSDLAAVATRGYRTPAGRWSVTGAKTWITHASRSDLMTILCRTAPGSNGYEGLSILLASKTRGSDAAPFPDDGLDGSEIPVLGYRGMKEYALAFDGFGVGDGSGGDGLLGGVEGQGFRQLMHTFESARIQTAARAVGVAWNAIDLALRYALDRRQFGQPLIVFPRIADKIALMVAETVMARELTYRSARRKDEGRRCDIEAGMAKLLAARVAWVSADLNVQIHGGNGYALEYEASRLLCDARVLNIFEGAAEIQAHVVGRGLLQPDP